MTIFETIFRSQTLTFCVLIVVFCFFMLFKNKVTLDMHIKINDAIHKYRCDCIVTNKIPKVDYDDEEAYEKTMWRLWDFGYKNILPKEKYEIIKEFIENKSE